jgi:hypothetical protein
MVAMRFIVGDGKEDAFDRLASELGGVPIEKAATNGQVSSRESSRMVNPIFKTGFKSVVVPL